MFVLLGVVVMGFLHLQFMLFWRSHYSHFPWPGSQAAMAQGLIPPFFTNSTLSLKHTMATLFAAPLLALWFARERPWVSTLAIWAGVMLFNSFVWVGTERLRHDSDLWPIDFVFLTFVTGIPLMLGSILALAMQCARRWMAP